MQESMVGSWKNYMGIGLMSIFFLAAWLYLFIKEKGKMQRVLLVYVPLFLLLLYFNPLFWRIFDRMNFAKVYFRCLWIIPFGTILAYTAVRIFGSLRGIRKQCLFLAAVFFLIAAGGRCVYESPLWRRAENPYHVPDSVVDICDAVKIEGREVTAVFPLEMILYVRQYCPVIHMPYGREIIMNDWTPVPPQSDLCDAMEAEEPDARILGTLAREDNCVYIIISEQKRLQGNLQEQGYYLFGKIDGYVIYKDIYFVPGV